MAQGSRIFRRKTTDTESSRLRFKDKQTFHGSYPNPSFIISGQCPDRVRKEISRSILLVIMMFYLKVVIHTIHPVCQWSQPTVAGFVVIEHIGDGFSFQLEKKPGHVFVAYIIEIDTFRSSQQETVIHPANRIDRFSGKFRLHFHPPGLFIKNHQTDIGSKQKPVAFLRFSDSQYLHRLIVRWRIIGEIIPYYIITG